MTRRAFTLIELMVVIAIMGLMGTISVGGYRAMRRGMEERSVMQSVNQFIRAAYQRAQIDRQPVSVYFWNETLQEATQTKPLIVTGKAVAVRRYGRITSVSGSELYDEFGDLNYNRLVLDEDTGQEASSSGSTSEAEGVYLYKIDSGTDSKPLRSVVSATTKKHILSEPLILRGEPQRGGTYKTPDMSDANIETYAFVAIDKKGVDWQVGDAYGFEFADIQLPDGYMFGSSYSQSAGNPVAGEQMLKFKVSVNTGNGARQGTVGSSTVQVSSLRPDASGRLTPQKVAVTSNPAMDM